MRKKILIISPFLTHPTNAGNRSCILSYSKMLKDMGYDVYFLWISMYRETYAETSQYWGDRFFIYDRGNQFFYRFSRNRFTIPLYDLFLKYRKNYNQLDDLYFFPYGIKRYLRKLQKEKQFDAVIVNYVFLSKILTYITNIKKILFTHDVFTNKYQHTGQKWFSLKSNDEARGLNRADTVLSIQEHESIYYRFLVQKKVFTVYSYFPVQRTPLIGKEKILYLASSNSYNIESITFFVEEVFPELDKLYPNIELIVGGAICNEIEHLVAGKTNIILQGHISDISLFYNQADICINPTFNGTGLKIKTFEALSFGKILISHPHSVLGIYEKEKAPIFLAETKEQYIERFMYLFNNTDSWNKLKTDSMEYMTHFNNYVKKQFYKAIES